MIENIHEFRSFCEKKGWKIDRYTSEFTIQFRLALFFQSLNSNFQIEFESNIKRYGLFNKTKKEIDLDIFEPCGNHSCIEIKYVRDKGSYNIGNLRFYEDIKFVEELIQSKKFNNGYCVLFTSLNELYTEPKKKINPKNNENFNLYKSFRVDRELKGTVTLRTGKLNRSVSLDGIYKIEWYDFDENVKYCIIEQ